MNKQILFVVPTIMSRPSFEISNLEINSKIFSNHRFLFISNVENNNFHNYNPKNKNIEKYISGVQFSISEAVNLGYSLNKDEYYFCFLQSDATITKEAIDSVIKLCDDPNMNSGVIGIRSHSQFRTYNKFMGNHYGLKVYKVLWSDGIMFMKSSLFETMCGFSNEYFGDKESQDFCYRVHHEGYNNLFIQPLESNIKWTHNSVGFGDKSKDNKKLYLKKVDESIKIFNNKWDKWEEKQKHLFV